MRMKIATDSARSYDENGYLHVAVSPLTKEAVNPYYGREIPAWQDLGLDPEKIYYGYRAGEELQKAVTTFNGVPILREHKLDSADNPLKEERVGFTGTSAVWKEPYIMNALTIVDKEAIELIEKDVKRELSASYQYAPVFKSGSFNGEKYDFIMTDIRANHVALVEEGRAGSDVLVYDGFKKDDKDPSLSKKINGEERMPKKEELREAARAFMEALDAFLKDAGEAAATGDSDYKEAMDKAGCDSESEAEQKAFAEGVKYAETLRADDEEESDEDEAASTDSDYKEAMDKAGCDSEDEKEQKAFAEGVKYAETLEKDPDERKRLDKEHESKGAEAALAGDRAMFSRREILRAEERGAAKAVAKMKSLYDAASVVKRTVSVNPLAYDSAEDIYKEALKRAGCDLTGVERSAYAGLYKAVTKTNINERVVVAADKANEENAFSKNIKVL